MVTQPHPVHTGRSTSRRRFTVAEYYGAAAAGIFQPGERLELIRGEIIQHMPQLPPHSTALVIAADTIREAVGPGHHIRQQSPLSLDNESEPEPDLLVVKGSPALFASRHPSPAEALLLIEVSDTTLRFDRREKGSLYAGAGIADYWILNLNARVLEVYRDPQPPGEPDRQHSYATALILNETEVLSPLFMADSVIRVQDMLPPLTLEH